MDGAGYIVNTNQNLPNNRNAVKSRRFDTSIYEPVVKQKSNQQEEPSKSFFSLGKSKLLDNKLDLLINVTLAIMVIFFVAVVAAFI